MKRIARNKRKESKAAKGELAPVIPKNVVEACREYIDDSTRHHISSGALLSSLRVMSTVIVKVRNVAIENVDTSMQVFHQLLQHATPIATKYEGCLTGVWNDERNLFVSMTWGLEPHCHEKEAPFAGRAAVALRSFLIKRGVLHEMTIGVSTNLNFTGFVANRLGLVGDDMRK
nr:hypothetical protein HK105_005968 [Polyrhizophydium stewartii]